MACLAISLAIAAATQLSCDPGAPSRAARVASLPWGAVDAPASGARLKGSFVVAGWALADDGVDSVCVYADRRFLRTAEWGLSRPDVARALPGHPLAARSGFAAELGAESLYPGSHTLTVQVRSRRGAVRELASIAVLFEP